MRFSCISAPRRERHVVLHVDLAEPDDLAAGAHGLHGGPERQRIAGRLQHHVDAAAAGFALAIATTSSVLALMPCVAPIRCASLSLPSSISTAMIFARAGQPRALHGRARPTAPQPITTDGIGHGRWWRC